MFARERQLFAVRTPGDAFDTERLLRVRMRPDSVVVCTVRIDDTNLDAIANVSDAALLLSHHGSDYGQQSRDREEHSFHISSPSTLTQEPPRKRLKRIAATKRHQRHIKKGSHLS